MPVARIIVVEDERIVAMDIRSTLERSGYAVPAVVSTGSEAVAAALQVEPDLVLMDISLPGRINGIEAARQIHSRLNVPVIYLTAYGSHPLADQYLANGTVECVVKPFDDGELLARIARVLSADRAALTGGAGPPREQGI